jgi:uncharacterized damage-inducible protein DinB
MKRLLLGIFALALGAPAQQRLPLQDDLWREFDLYRDRLFQLARAIPAEKYGWRPAQGVRSVQEVVLHAALNNYMLLDMMGQRPPAELYPGLPENALEQQRAVARRGVDIEKEPRGKDDVLKMAERAFGAIAGPLKETTAEGLSRPATFFDRKSTVGGIEVRAVMHLHEHLGQLIAYARMIGVVPPWSQ